MMALIVITGTVLAATHSLTYAWWLKEQGNRPGALLVTALSLAVCGLTFWRTIMT